MFKILQTAKIALSAVIPPDILHDRRWFSIKHRKINNIMTLKTTLTPTYQKINSIEMSQKLEKVIIGRKICEHAV